MIIYGTKSKVQPTLTPVNLQCPNCSSNQFGGFGEIKYFHLFWIPVFLFSKSVHVICNNCRKLLKDKEIPQQHIIDKIKKNTFTTKRILIHFTGLFLFIALIFFAVHRAEQNNIKDLAYIQSPAVNDLYIINFHALLNKGDSEYKYGITRVKRFVKDQVELEISKGLFSSTYGPRKEIKNGKARSDSYYSGKLIYIDIAKLKVLKKKKIISSVHR